MKKSLLLIIMVILVMVMFSTNISAEIKKGDWLITTKNRLRFTDSRNKGEDDSLVTIDFCIALKKLLINNFALGGGWYLEDNDYSSSENFFIEGSFYFQPEKIFNPYIAARLSYLTYNEGTVKGDGFAYGAVLGVIGFFNKYVGVDIGLSYFNKEYDYDYIDLEQKTRDIDFEIGFLLKFD